MNYEEKSNLEIAARVLYVKGVPSKIEHKTCFIDHGFEDGANLYTAFDPCNSPRDAWPIIESIWDELMSPPYRSYGTKWERFMSDYNCGKLRAAMICFLKMKDAESNAN